MQAVKHNWKFKLTEPLEHKTRIIPGGEFKNVWIEISVIKPTGCPHLIALLKVATAYAWDGCTGAPDLPGTKDASCLHDVVYQFVDAIARAWGWSVRRVLKWADKIFRERMVLDKAKPWVVKTYYRAVRIAGYTFNRTRRFLKGVKTWVA